MAVMVSPERLSKVSVVSPPDEPLPSDSFLLLEKVRVALLTVALEKVTRPLECLSPSSSTAWKYQVLLPSRSTLMVTSSPASRVSSRMSSELEKLLDLDMYRRSISSLDLLTILSAVSPEETVMVLSLACSNLLPSLSSTVT